MQPHETMILRANHGASSHLVIFLHGVGADAAAMLPLASACIHACPDMTAAVPAGFDAFDLASHGRQWFSVKSVTEENRPERVRRALPRLIGLVRTLQEEHGVSPRDTVLVGFSQGGIMALEAAKTPVAGHVVSIGSRFASLPATWPAQTSVHLLHGARDTVIDVEHSRQAAARLQALGVAVRLDVVENAGHVLHDVFGHAHIAEMCRDLDMRKTNARQVPA